MSATQQATPQEALARLDAHALELDRLSSMLAEVQRAIEPVEVEYQGFIDAYEVGLWLQSQADGGPKLPSEALRVKLARREMAPGLLGRRDGLIRKRERIRERIGDLKRVVDAERSILSALKESA